MAKSSLKITSSGRPRAGSRIDYLGAKRMEKNRRQLQTILDDIYQVIPLQDWRYLVSLSRQLVINNGLLKGIIEDKATGVVGDGMDPEFLGANEAWGEKAKTWLVDEWMPQAELRGILDFKDLQFQKSTNMDASGDVFRLLTNRRDGMPAIQLIQAHRIGQRDGGDLIASGPYAGMRIENGIISLPDTGEVVAYNVLGETEEKDRIIPRGPMAHLLDPVFADQVRGLPAALAGLRALVMSEKTDENEEDFVEMVSRLFFIEKNPEGEAGPDFGGGNPDLDGNDGADTTNPRLLDLWHGLAKVFQSGTDSGIEAFNPGDRPSEAFDRFSDRRYRIICAGIGWPYELAWKLGELTSVGVHSVEQKAQRTIRDRQSKIIPSAIQEIRWAIAGAINMGILAPDPDWKKWGLTLPPKYSLNPTKAADSRRKDLELGLTTVGRILKEEGTPGGAKALFRERANEIADKKAIRDEVSTAKGQPISDEEMGKTGLGSTAAPASGNPNEGAGIAGIEEVKATADAFGVAVRAGAITPTAEDEDHFRNKLQIPSKPAAIATAWAEDGGFRRPITLLQKGAAPAPAKPSEPDDDDTEEDDNEDPKKKEPKK